MSKVIETLSDILNRLKGWDKKKIEQELGEVGRYFLKHLFNQIPGATALAAILVGAWVASTFTTNPLMAVLSTFGVIKGGTRVVSRGAYRFLSIFLPVLAAAVTAYVVQKGLKYFREKQMEENKAQVTLLPVELQAALQAKLDLLAKAREADLLSDGEYFTKKANLYQTYGRIVPDKIKEMISKKLWG